MPRLPTIYTARSDVETAHLARVEDWYARRHAPDLIRAGFYTAQVYYSEVGTPRVCNLYEIPGPELFVTQGYRDVAAKDTEGPAVIALLTSRSNTIYDQVLTVNVPADGPTGRRAGGPAASWPLPCPRSGSSCRRPAQARLTRSRPRATHAGS